MSYIDLAKLTWTNPAKIYIQKKRAVVLVWPAFKLEIIARKMTWPGILIASNTRAVRECPSRESLKNKKDIFLSVLNGTVMFAVTSHSCVIATNVGDPKRAGLKLLTTMWKLSSEILIQKTVRIGRPQSKIIQTHLTPGAGNHKNVKKSLLTDSSCTTSDLLVERIWWNSDLRNIIL